MDFIHISKIAYFFGQNSITFLKVTPAFIQSSKRPFYLWPGFLCWHRLFFKWPDFYICDQTHFPLTFLQGLIWHGFYLQCPGFSSKWYSFLFKNIQKSSNSRDMKEKKPSESLCISHHCIIRKHFSFQVSTYAKICTLYINKAEKVWEENQISGI